MEKIIFFPLPLSPIFIHSNAYAASIPISVLVEFSKKKPLRNAYETKLVARITGIRMRIKACAPGDSENSENLRAIPSPLCA